MLRLALLPVAPGLPGTGCAVDQRFALGAQRGSHDGTAESPFRYVAIDAGSMSAIISKIFSFKACPVTTGEANARGLYEMHGHEWEGCQHWYGYYPSGSVTDPTGPPSGYAPRDSRRQLVRLPGDLSVGEPGQERDGDSSRNQRSRRAPEEAGWSCPLLRMVGVAFWRGSMASAAGCWEKRKCRFLVAGATRDEKDFAPRYQ